MKRTLINTCKELNIGMSTAVEFCKKHGKVIETDPNARITDEMYLLLAKEFNKDIALKLEVLERLVGILEGLFSEKKTEQSYETTSDVKSPKQIVEGKYQILIQQLEAAKEAVSQYNAKNTKLANLQTDFANEFAHQIESVEQLMNQTINGMVWDNLVIAFFGETNAGKSTTIETLRILFDQNKDQNKDGLIVGDGRADFTQTYDEYHLNIFDRPFTLIDVPGIEGKEDDFKDDIKRALQQAHLVFYIQGHNKKPDVATAEKIKKYLNDWVNVYSIYNVRGGAGNYDEVEERDNLYTSDVNKTYTLIEETFQNILGDVYQGNIAVQALLAMCAKASFAEEREDLSNTQHKLISYFGSAENVYEFSQFEKIVSLIQQKTLHFEEELIAANKQKLVAISNKVVEALSLFENNKGNEIETMLKKLKQYDGALCSTISGIKNSLKSTILSASNRQFSTLQMELCNYIDSVKEIDAIKSLLSGTMIEFEANFQKIIQNKLDSEIAKINTKLKGHQKDYLDCYKKLPDLNLNSIQLPKVQIDDIIEQLETTFADFLKGAVSFAATVASGAGIGLIGGPGGAITGGLGAAAVWGIKKIFSSDAQDKANAKNVIKKQLQSARDRSNSKLSNQIDNLATEIGHKLNLILKNIESDTRYIREIRDIMSENNDKLKLYIQDLKELS